MSETIEEYDALIMTDDKLEKETELVKKLKKIEWNIKYYNEGIADYKEKLGIYLIAKESVEQELNNL